MTPEKALALKNKINKELKHEVAFKGTDVEIPMRYTSGSVSLDVALGGGFPANVWTEIVGPFSAGKTSLMFKTIAANQANNPHFTALWVAAEKFDADTAAALGVDLDRMIVVNMQDMATAFAVMLEAVETRAVDMVILDSYPALVPEDEAEKGMNEFVVGSGARLMNKFIRKANLVSNIDGPPFAGIIINQWRDKIGGFSPYGTPQTTPGGKGKDYFFFTRLELKRDDWIEEKRPNFEKPVKVGQTIRCHTIKNKSAAPQQTATIDYYFRRAPYLGFARGEYDMAKDCVFTGIQFGIINKGGAWLKYNGQQWQGKEKMMEELRINPPLLKQLYDEVLTVASDPKNADKGLTDE